MRASLAVTLLLAATAHASSLVHETVSSVSRRAVPRYKRCYEAALKRDSPTTSGKAHVTITVRPSGAVEEVDVAFPDASPLFVQCLRDVTSRLRFPEEPERYVVVWPLTFLPK